MSVCGLLPPMTTDELMTSVNTEMGIGVIRVPQSRICSKEEEQGVLTGQVYDQAYISSKNRYRDTLER